MRWLDQRERGRRAALGAGRAIQGWRLAPSRRIGQLIGRANAALRGCQPFCWATGTKPTNSVGSRVTTIVLDLRRAFLSSAAIRLFIVATISLR